MGFFGFRRIVEDYETRFRPVDAELAGAIRGKVEWELDADDVEELWLRVGRLALPDGARVDVRLRDEVIGQAPVERGRAELRIEGRRGDGRVPAVRSGDPIVLTWEGRTLAEGRFVPD